MKKFHTFDCGCEIEIDQDLEPWNPYTPPLILDINHINENCPKTWELLKQGNTKGVFQLDGHLGKHWSKRLRPEDIEELAALISLLRPGCLTAEIKPGISMTEMYCLRKDKLEPIEYIHPSLENILKKTQGILTYQESSMHIVSQLAGFNLMEADKLRKAIGHKLAEEMAKVKGWFLEKAKTYGVVREQEASDIFGWIEKSQRYSFNKCIAYSEVIRKNSYNGRKPFPHKYGYTVEHMYRIKNDKKYAAYCGQIGLYRKWNKLGHYGTGLSLCDDGRIRPNIIRDIQSAGVQQVFKVTLSTGQEIRVTPTHKFPTPNGIKEAQNLLVGDLLYLCGQYDPSRKSYRFSHFTKKDIDKRIQTNKVWIYQGFGEDNCGYTNGGWIEFKKNQELLPQHCMICSEEEGKIETHHIDGDRTHNTIDNLIKLCCSCHKKVEYKKGRTRGGEKGYPYSISQIEKIEPDEYCKTYDVTMDGPNHNFVTGDNIVTSNSHAVSYASLSYLTAYCKAHFPVAFFCSYLTYAKKKQDTYGEVQKLVDNSRTMDIDVLPPDFRNLEPEFSTDGKLITFGLADIRGVGFDGVNKLKEIVPKVEQQIGKSRDNWTWLDFLINMTPHLDLTTVRGFIEVGGLRYFQQPRALMAHEYLQVWRQLTPTAVKWITKNYQQYNSLLDALKEFVKLEGRKQGGANKPQREAIQSFINGMENPSTKLTDTPDRISAGEENSLGVAITCTKVDNYDISLVDTSCKELVNGKRADYIVMGVEVQNVKEVVTKKGKNPGQPMAFLTVRDSTCSCDDVMVPPKVWEENNSLFTIGRTLLLRGGTDKKKGTFIVQKVWPLSLNP